MLRLGAALCLLVLFFGCSRMTMPTSLPVTNQVAADKAKFQTLYSFNGAPDGAVPIGGVIDVGGTLYGTTNYGGDVTKYCYPGTGCGTVYAIAASGSETVLYRFKVATGGLRPYAGLTSVNGTLFGTTQEGGAHGKGMIFTITPSGTLTAIFSFTGKDGDYPRAELSDVNGVLYGTTTFGGVAGVGTVFSLKSAGSKYTEKPLHEFKGPDGALPSGSLISVNGALYGTTSLGGATNNGTVFAIAKGKESFLYSFQGGADGSQPLAGLTELNGTLYGTTLLGGAAGEGTVFAISASGAESVLHSFAGGSDGAEPVGGLTVFNGKIYGTTLYGGSKDAGTVFALTPAGAETIVHSFTGTADGDHPTSTLVSAYSALYGTTTKGGSNSHGTVFEVSP